jgi:FkbM family methyltransferase
VKRLLRPDAASGGDLIRVQLPWSSWIEIDLKDGIGQTIAMNGVWDLPVTELIFRLVDPGEAAADVGANIGYMTSAMAAAIGGGGRIYAFEPHPQVFARLSDNCKSWTSEHSQIELFELALSDCSGTVPLYTNELFPSNQGQARLHEAPRDVSTPVRTERLDELLQPPIALGVMKIDVEGGELGVLVGADRMLAAHRVRDVIFEEHRPYPTDVTTLLERHGYEVMSVGSSLSGVRLVGPDAVLEAKSDRSFLATLDADRARRRVQRLGCRSLRVSHTRRDLISAKRTAF